MAFADSFGSSFKTNKYVRFPIPLYIGTVGQMHVYPMGGDGETPSSGFLEDSYCTRMGGMEASSRAPNPASVKTMEQASVMWMRAPLQGISAPIRGLLAQIGPRLTRSS